ncbi:sugar transport protein [Salmonella enterica subsp. arizonae]|uniref:Sugar transport protein n=1 Tax=Salmonella enterica subsp. arizonae TaxID=59203 RepID=A0A379THY4_SALER|nr:sugar transport protein [Salmonella enterica subsp. arizonae]
MVILTVMAVSVEVGRWLWFHGGRLPFHLLAAVAGVIVVFHPGDIITARAPA